MEQNRKVVAEAEPGSSRSCYDDIEIKETRSSQVDTENRISELIAALERKASSSGGFFGAVAMDTDVEAARNGDAARYHADEGQIKSGGIV